jgi:hypothetical protein
MIERGKETEIKLYLLIYMLTPNTLNFFHKLAVPAELARISNRSCSPQPGSYIPFRVVFMTLPELLLGSDGNTKICLGR